MKRSILLALVLFAASAFAQSKPDTTITLDLAKIARMASNVRANLQQLTERRNQASTDPAKFLLDVIHELDIAITKAQAQLDVLTFIKTDTLVRFQPARPNITFGAEPLKKDSTTVVPSEAGKKTKKK